MSAIVSDRMDMRGVAGRLYETRLAGPQRVPPEVPRRRSSAKSKKGELGAEARRTQGQTAVLRPDCPPAGAEGVRVAGVLVVHDDVRVD